MESARTAGESADCDRSRITFWGAAYASRNLGDIAVTTTLLERIRYECPDSTITLMTSGRYVDHLQLFADVSVVSPRRQPFRALRQLLRSELLVIAGGVPIRNSLPAMLCMLCIMLVARLGGSKISIVSTSCEELTGINRILVKAILALANETAVRDCCSRRILQAAAPKAAIGLQPDIVCALHVEQTNSVLGSFLPALNPERPYVLIAPRNFLAGRRYIQKHFAALAPSHVPALLETMSAATAALLERYQVVYVAMDSHEDDAAVGHAVAQKLGMPPELLVIDRQLTLNEAFALVRGATLVLAMRLHAVVFSFMTETPFVALSYSHKVKGFVEWTRTGQPVFSLTVEADTLIAACRKTIEQRKDLSSRRERVRKSRQEIRAAFHRLARFVGPQVRRLSTLLLERAPRS